MTRDECPNHKFQAANRKIILFEHWLLKFEDRLGFGAWYLEFTKVPILLL